MNRKKTYIIAGVFTALLLLSALLYKQLAKGFENEEAFTPQSESRLASEESDVPFATGENDDSTTQAIDPTVLPDSNSVEGNTSEAEVDKSTDISTDKSKENIAPLDEQSNKVNNQSNNSTNKPEKAATDKVTNVAPTKAPIKQDNNSVQPTKTPQVNTPIPTNTPAPTSTPFPTSTPVPTRPVNKNTATNFTVYDSNGNAVSLSDYFGKPIVVNFWASWCGPCKSEMPGFDSMYQRYKGSVTFLMVDMVDGYRETKETGQNFISKNGFSFPVFYDTKQSASYAYSITSYPTTLFINADGSIATIKKGAMSESTLENEINKILN